MKKINVAILGASGYTGVELIRILLNHPHTEIKCLIANNSSGQNIDELYPHLIHYNLPKIIKLDEADFSNIDVVFGCLPHTTSQESFKQIMSNPKNFHLKMIDLSADFRLDDVNNYKLWYQHEHIAPELQKSAVYGLTEINRNKIKKSSLIACPGCYPTSILLPLIPLFEFNLIKESAIIVDSKSGATGAGRSLKQNMLFCEVNESAKAYSIASHRHIGEIEQELSKVVNQKITIEFTPHILPISRGIISTIYGEINDGFTIENLRNCLETKYEDEKFVRIVNSAPNLKDVSGSNFCLISIHPARAQNKFIIVSVIDNLCKGSSGQAVQNMNLIFELEESVGLNFPPLFP